MALLLCFGVNDIVPAYAASPMLTPAPPIQPASRPDSWLAIPKDLGVVEDLFFQNNSDSNTRQDLSKTIILIQDAHTNDSAQLNISRLLNHIYSQSSDVDVEMNGQGPMTVYVEAGDGDCSLSALRSLAPLDQRQEIGMKYLTQGQLTGEEYLNLSSDLPMLIWGVEDRALYLQGLEAYKYVLKNRQPLQDYLARIQKTIDFLKQKFYSAKLLKLDSMRKDLLSDKISLANYAKKLSYMARRSAVGIHLYPNLQEFLRLSKREEIIDFKKVNTQLSVAFQILPAEIRQQLTQIRDEAFKGAHDQRLFASREAFYFLLQKNIEQALGDAARSQFPDLYAYFDYLDRASQINFHQLVLEIEDVEDKLYRGMLDNEDNAHIYRCDQATHHLQELFALSITADNTRRSLEDLRDLDIRQITGFLNQKLLELSEGYDKALFLESGYQGLYDKAIEFYALTRLRDEQMIKRLILHKQNTPVDSRANVLIAGGYHAPYLKKLLINSGYNYISIVPNVLKETNDGRYEKILLERAQCVGISNNTFADGARADMTRPWETAQSSFVQTLREELMSSAGVNAQVGARLTKRVGVRDELKWTPLDSRAKSSGASRQKPLQLTASTASALDNARKIHEAYILQKRVSSSKAFSALQAVAEKVVPPRAFKEFDVFLSVAMERYYNKAGYLWVTVYPVLLQIESQPAKAFEILRKEAQILQTPLTWKQKRAQPEVLEVIWDALTKAKEFVLYPDTVKWPVQGGSTIGGELRRAYASVNLNHSIDSLPDWDSALRRAGLNPDDYKSARARKAVATRQKGPQSKVYWVATDSTGKVKSKKLIYQAQTLQTRSVKAALPRRAKSGYLLIEGLTVYDSSAKHQLVTVMGTSYPVDVSQGQSMPPASVVLSPNTWTVQRIQIEGNTVYPYAAQRKIYEAKGEPDEDVQAFLKADRDLLKATETIDRAFFEADTDSGRTTYWVSDVPMYRSETRNPENTEQRLTTFNLGNQSYTTDIVHDPDTQQNAIVYYDSKKGLVVAAYDTRGRRIYPSSTHMKIFLDSLSEASNGREQAPYATLGGFQAEFWQRPEVKKARSMTVESYPAISSVHGENAKTRQATLAFIFQGQKYVTDTPFEEGVTLRVVFKKWRGVWHPQEAFRESNDTQVYPSRTQRSVYVANKNFDIQKFASDRQSQAQLVMCSSNLQSSQLGLAKTIGTDVFVYTGVLTRNAQGAQVFNLFNSSAPYATAYSYEEAQREIIVIADSKGQNVLAAYDAETLTQIHPLPDNFERSRDGVHVSVSPVTVEKMDRSRLGREVFSIPLKNYEQRDKVANYILGKSFLRQLGIVANKDIWLRLRNFNHLEVRFRVRSKVKGLRSKPETIIDILQPNNSAKVLHSYFYLADEQRFVELGTRDHFVARMRQMPGTPDYEGPYTWSLEVGRSSIPPSGYYLFRDGRRPASNRSVHLGFGRLRANYPGHPRVLPTTIYLRTEDIGKGQTEVLAFEDPKQTLPQEALGRWVWDEKNSEMSFDHFSPLGSFSWFERAAQGKRSFKKPAYKVCSIHGNPSTIELPLGLSSRVAKELGQADVSLAQAVIYPQDPLRIMIYTDKKGEPAFGEFSGLGKRPFAVRYFEKSASGSHYNLVDDWRVATQRLKQLKKGSTPKPVIISIYSEQGHPTKIMENLDGTTISTTAGSSEEFFLIRYDKDRKIRLYILDEYMMPYRLANTGRIVNGQFQWDQSFQAKNDFDFADEIETVHYMLKHGILSREHVAQRWMRGIERELRDLNEIAKDMGEATLAELGSISGRIQYSIRRIEQLSLALDEMIAVIKKMDETSYQQLQGEYEAILERRSEQEMELNALHRSVLGKAQSATAGARMAEIQGRGERQKGKGNRESEIGQNQEQGSRMAKSQIPNEVSLATDSVTPVAFELTKQYDPFASSLQSPTIYYDVTYPGHETADSTFGITVELRADHMDWVNIQLPDDAPPGMASSIAEWLVRLSTQLYPDSSQPLRIVQVQNPQILRIAEKIFLRESIRIIDHLDDDPTDPNQPRSFALDDADLDIYERFGPISLYGYDDVDGEIVAKKDESGRYQVLSAPEGVEVDFDDWRMNIRSARTSSLLGYTHFDKKFEIRGTPRPSIAIMNGKTAGGYTKEHLDVMTRASEVPTQQLIDRFHAYTGTVYYPFALVDFWTAVDLARWFPKAQLVLLDKFDSKGTPLSIKAGLADSPQDIIAFLTRRFSVQPRIGVHKTTWSNESVLAENNPVVVEPIDVSTGRYQVTFNFNEEFGRLDDRRFQYTLQTMRRLLGTTIPKQMTFEYRVGDFYSTDVKAGVVVLRRPGWAGQLLPGAKLWKKLDKVLADEPSGLVLMFNDKGYLRPHGPHEFVRDPYASEVVNHLFDRGYARLIPSGDSDPFHIEGYGVNLYQKSSGVGARLSTSQTPVSPRAYRLPEQLPEDYLVLSPAWNEAGNLRRYIQDVREAGYLDHAVWVNDGSTDQTVERLREAQDTFYIDFEKNQQKEGSIVSAINWLRQEYQKAGKVFPEYIVVTDADTYIEPWFMSRDTESVLLSEINKMRQRGVVAASLDLAANLKHGFPSLWQWMQALDWRLMGPQYLFRIFRLNPAMPGGATIYRADDFLEAMKETSGNFKSRPIELRDAFARQGKKTGYPRLLLRGRTEVFRGLGQYMRERMKWWEGIFANHATAYAVFIPLLDVTLWKLHDWSGQASLVNYLAVTLVMTVPGVAWLLIRWTLYQASRFYYFALNSIMRAIQPSGSFDAKPRVEVYLAELVPLSGIFIYFTTATGMLLAHLALGKKVVSLAQTLAKRKTDTGKSSQGARFSIQDRLILELEKTIHRDIDPVNDVEYIEEDGYHILLSRNNSGVIDGFAVTRPAQPSVESFRVRGNSKNSQIQSELNGILITLYENNATEVDRDITDQWFVGLQSSEYVIQTLRQDGKVSRAILPILGWSIDNEFAGARMTKDNASQVALVNYFKLLITDAPKRQIASALRSLKSSGASPLQFELSPRTQGFYYIASVSRPSVDGKKSKAIILSFSLANTSKAKVTTLFNKIGRPYLKIEGLNNRGKVVKGKTIYKTSNGSTLFSVDEKGDDLLQDKFTTYARAMAMGDAVLAQQALDSLKPRGVAKPLSFELEPIADKYFIGSFTIATAAGEENERVSLALFAGETAKARLTILFNKDGRPYLKIERLNKRGKVIKAKTSYKTSTGSTLFDVDAKGDDLLQDKFKAYALAMATVDLAAAQKAIETLKSPDVDNPLSFELVPNGSTYYIGSFRPKSEDEQEHKRINLTFYLGKTKKARVTVLFNKYGRPYLKVEGLDANGRVIKGGARYLAFVGDSLLTVDETGDDVLAGQSKLRRGSEASAFTAYVKALAKADETAIQEAVEALKPEVDGSPVSFELTPSGQRDLYYIGAFTVEEDNRQKSSPVGLVFYLLNSAKAKVTILFNQASKPYLKIEFYDENGKSVVDEKRRPIVYYKTSGGGRLFDVDEKGDIRLGQYFTDYAKALASGDMTLTQEALDNLKSKDSGSPASFELTPRDGGLYVVGSFRHQNAGDQKSKQIDLSFSLMNTSKANVTILFNQTGRPYLKIEFYDGKGRPVLDNDDMPIIYYKTSTGYRLFDVDQEGGDLEGNAGARMAKGQEPSLKEVQETLSQILGYSLEGEADKQQRDIAQALDIFSQAKDALMATERGEVDGVSQKDNGILRAVEQGASEYSIYVGDLHGVTANLEGILELYLKDVLSGKAKLFFTGDILHPAIATTEYSHIMSLKALIAVFYLISIAPDNVHIVLADHEAVHATADGIVAKGKTNQRQELDDAMQMWALSGNASVDALKRSLADTVRYLPALIQFRIEDPNTPDVVLSHASPDENLDLNELSSQLVWDSPDDVASRSLTSAAHQLAWSRNYSEKSLMVRANLGKRQGKDAPALVVSGHSTPMSLMSQQIDGLTTHYSTRPGLKTPLASVITSVIPGDELTHVVLDATSFNAETGFIALRVDHESSAGAKAHHLIHLSQSSKGNDQAWQVTVIKDDSPESLLLERREILMNMAYQDFIDAIVKDCPEGTPASQLSAKAIIIKKLFREFKDSVWESVQPTASEEESIQTVDIETAKLASEYCSRALDAVIRLGYERVNEAYQNALDQAEAVILKTGSYALNRATPYSDVDLIYVGASEPSTAIDKIEGKAISSLNRFFMDALEHGFITYTKDEFLDTLDMHETDQPLAGHYEEPRTLFTRAISFEPVVGQASWEKEKLSEEIATRMRSNAPIVLRWLSLDRARRYDDEKSASKVFKDGFGGTREWDGLSWLEQYARYLDSDHAGRIHKLMKQSESAMWRQNIRRARYKNDTYDMPEPAYENFIRDAVELFDAYSRAINVLWPAVRMEGQDPAHLNLSLSTPSDSDLSQVVPVAPHPYAHSSDMSMSINLWPSGVPGVHKMAFSTSEKRLGLLTDILGVLALYKLGVKRATIETVDTGSFDVFWVQGVPEDEQEQWKLAQAIILSLEQLIKPGQAYQPQAIEAVYSSRQAPYIFERKKPMYGGSKNRPFADIVAHQGNLILTFAAEDLQAPGLLHLITRFLAQKGISVQGSTQIRSQAGLVFDTLNIEFPWEVEVDTSQLEHELREFLRLSRYDAATFANMGDAVSSASGARFASQKDSAKNPGAAQVDQIDEKSLLVSEGARMSSKEEPMKGYELASFLANNLTGREYFGKHDRQITMRLVGLDRSQDVSLTISKASVTNHDPLADVMRFYGLQSGLSKDQIYDLEFDVSVDTTSSLLTLQPAKLIALRKKLQAEAQEAKVTKDPILRNKRIIALMYRYSRPSERQYFPANEIPQEILDLKTSFVTDEKVLWDLHIHKPELYFRFLIYKNLLEGKFPVAASDLAGTMVNFTDASLFTGIASEMSRALSSGPVVLVTGDPFDTVDQKFIELILEKNELTLAHLRNLHILTLAGVEYWTHDEDNPGNFKAESLVEGISDEHINRIEHILEDIGRSYELPRKFPISREYNPGQIEIRRAVKGSVIAYMPSGKLNKAQRTEFESNLGNQNLLFAITDEINRRLDNINYERQESGLAPIKAVKGGLTTIDITPGDKGVALKVFRKRMLRDNPKYYYVFTGDNISKGGNDSAALAEAEIAIQVGSKEPEGLIIPDGHRVLKWKVINSERGAGFALGQQSKIWRLIRAYGLEQEPLHPANGARLTASQEGTQTENKESQNRTNMLNAVLAHITLADLTRWRTEATAAKKQNQPVSLSGLPDGVHYLGSGIDHLVLSADTLMRPDGNGWAIKIYWRDIKAARAGSVTGVSSFVQSPEEISRRRKQLRDAKSSPIYHEYEWSLDDAKRPVVLQRNVQTFSNLMRQEQEVGALSETPERARLMAEHILSLWKAGLFDADPYWANMGIYPGNKETIENIRQIDEGFVYELGTIDDQVNGYMSPVEFFLYNILKNGRLFSSIRINLDFYKTIFKDVNYGDLINAKAVFENAETEASKGKTTSQIVENFLRTLRSETNKPFLDKLANNMRIPQNVGARFANGSVDLSPWLATSTEEMASIYGSWQSTRQNLADYFLGRSNELYEVTDQGSYWTTRGHGYSDINKLILFDAIAGAASELAITPEQFQERFVVIVAGSTARLEGHGSSDIDFLLLSAGDEESDADLAKVMRQSVVDRLEKYRYRIVESNLTYDFKLYSVRRLKELLAREQVEVTYELADRGFTHTSPAETYLVRNEMMDAVYLMGNQEVYEELMAGRYEALGSANSEFDTKLRNDYIASVTSVRQTDLKIKPTPKKFKDLTRQFLIFSYLVRLVRQWDGSPNFESLQKELEIDDTIGRAYSDLMHVRGYYEMLISEGKALYEPALATINRALGTNYSTPEELLLELNKKLHIASKRMDEILVGENLFYSTAHISTAHIGARFASSITARVDNASETVRFSVRAAHEQEVDLSQEKTIVIGSGIISLKENSRGDILVSLMGQEYTLIKRQDIPSYINAAKDDHAAIQAAISMSDLKLLLQKSFDIIEDGLPDINVEQKAVIVLDLDAMSPSSETYHKLTKPLLLAELEHATKSLWGRQLAFVLSSSDSHIIQAFMEDAPAHLREYMFQDADALPTDLKTVPSIRVTSAHGIDVKAKKHFFFAGPKEGDILALRAILKASATLARIQDFSADNKDYESVLKFLGVLTGRPVQAGPFAQIILDPSSVDTERIERDFAVPAIVRIAISSLIQAARLAKAMTEQAA